jgi:hypothetical protein
LYEFGQDDGAIAVQQGSLVAFSNSHLVHKVGLVTNPRYCTQFACLLAIGLAWLGLHWSMHSSDLTAGRGYIAFFIIDPAKPRTLSTATLPCLDIVAQARRLDRLLGPYNGVLPIELLCHICQLAGMGRTVQEKAEAKQYWRDLAAKYAEESTKEMACEEFFMYRHGWGAMDGGVARFRPKV